MNRQLFSFLVLVVMTLIATTQGFVPLQSTPSRTGATRAESSSINGEHDANEVVARRIIVKGAVQGGYYRSCVLNEAGRFRRLIGTMSPPDDSDEAEIYVEGKKKMVEGFIRWCEKGNVGLSQVVGVSKVTEEEPTGLYDGFYVKTK